VAPSWPMTSGIGRSPRIPVVLRDGEAKVTPLELFFDLVFVLALTQGTALMAADPTWAGIGRALLILAMLWWSWVGYSWLTSVVDPEEGPIRIAMFVAMAAFLVAALAVPTAFDDNGLLFAGAYAVVRLAHICLFVMASREDTGLRRSVYGLAISTAIGVGLLGVAGLTDGPIQVSLWAIAVLLDVGGPLVIDPSGWRLSAEHFAERHALIVIIALGESIVALGVGAEGVLDIGVVVAAIFGIAVCAALWWTYFDVVALAAADRLARAPAGREQNTMARDSFSYLHFPLIAGVTLLALGLKKTLGDTGSPLKPEGAVAILGGVAVYLGAMSLLRRRNIGSFSRPRLVVATALLALVPVATAVPAIVILALVFVVLAGLIGYETARYANGRAQIRRELRR
jgi:low temperature requirement protein LtrA